MQSNTSDGHACRFRVLDFLKIDAVMADTISIKDELKRAVDVAVASVEKIPAE